jgi:hypothetical protein
MFSLYWFCSWIEQQVSVFQTIGLAEQEKSPANRAF